MSARRQASTTSLSRYARSGSPDFTNRSLDFCNAFWGLDDAGVEVLFARMRGAMRTMEELRNFWKERASIEEQYAKRLAGLAKITLGRDEIGELRTSLDTLKRETDKQAQAHLLVAQAIKADLEGTTSSFQGKQQQHKRGIQAQIEKEWKNKQTQEGYVARAREKYEQDCMKINSYTAQSTLIQGRDLEKVHLKLERAQQTVQANQRDYANFARALQDTLQKWEQSWKTYCDSCQDIEEERVEFMKDNMWAYANAVSTVCVSDDEACEYIRLSLEQLEVEKDMENFVRDYGTGNGIPDPPPYTDYSNPHAQPASSQHKTTHPADFARQSQRPRQAPPPPQAQTEPEPEAVEVDMAGVGAGGNRAAGLERAQTQSRASSRAQAAQPNGVGRAASNVGTRAADPEADPIDPTAPTMIKIGPNAYEVNLDKDPQAHSGPPIANGSSLNSQVGQDDDPLQRQMNELKSGPGGGSVRRNSQWKPQQPQQPSPPQPQQSPSGSGSQRDPGGKFSPPPGATQAARDWRKSAEVVVGAYPAQATSRPVSPNPKATPQAVFMRPPSRNAPASGVSVPDVVEAYGQSLPGERKSISRSNSRSNSISVPAPQASSIRGRPNSSESNQAGIGARGRSTSPQPFVPLSRSASPALQGPPSIVSNRNSYGRPPPSNGPPPGHGHAHSNSTQGSISIPKQPTHRPTSPGIGIQLDSNGRVIGDDMAAMYRQPQQPTPVQQPQYAAPPPHQPQPSQLQRNPSHSAGPNGVPGYVPQQPSHAAVYNASQPQQHAYGPPHQNPAYAQHPQQPYTQAPPPQNYPQYGQVGNALVRGGSISMNGGYYPPSQQPIQQMQQFRPPSPRAPSPQPPNNKTSPTGAWTEDGRPILFYVKAMYNYRATIDEEFDFQEGDIIAVTATPEDGWWSGELLDESRREAGRHIFPSNFVCLF